MLKHKFTTNSLSNITQVIRSGNMGYGSLVKELEEKFGD